MKQLKKLRQCFIYEQQYFMVESFCNVDGSPSLLRIETTKEGKNIKIPPFVKVLKDVTEDSQYASSTMARHQYKMPEADKKSIKFELQGQPGSNTLQVPSATKQVPAKETVTQSSMLISPSELSMNKMPKTSPRSSSPSEKNKL